MGKETGGPAFAATGHPGQQFVQQEGMTLRDYFAAKAMQGWLSSYSENEAHPATNGNEHTVAENAYKMADAMLKVRGE